MDTSLQNKLQAFSADPPEGVWAKIADALDSEGMFSQRLYDYEAQPPTAAWEKIEKGLEKNSEGANVVPLNSPVKKIFRYAATACVIAVVMITITLTVRRTEAGAIQAGSNTTVPTSNQQMVVQKAGSAKNLSPNEATTRREKTDSSPLLKINDNVVASLETDARTDTPSAMLSSFNEYVVFSDGDGKQRRVSKKLAGLIQCKDGDVLCKQRLQQLRQTLASTAMTTDFTGVLEMMRQLR